MIITIRHHVTFLFVLLFFSSSALATNRLKEKSSQFLHNCPLMTELLENGSVSLGETRYTAEELQRATAVVYYETPYFNPSEITRTINEAIAEAEEEEGSLPGYRRIQIEQGIREEVGFSEAEIQQRIRLAIGTGEHTSGRHLHDSERDQIIGEVRHQYPQKIDSQALEAAGITIVHRTPEEVKNTFYNFDNYATMVPSVFTESRAIGGEEVDIELSEHEALQYVTFQVSSPSELISYRRLFSQTLLYEVESEELSQSRQKYIIAWEIDPRLKSHRDFGTRNIHVNSGYILISPYGENRTAVLYHCYIKVDMNYYAAYFVPHAAKRLVIRQMIQDLADSLR